MKGTDKRRATRWVAMVAGAGVIATAAALAAQRPPVMPAPKSDDSQRASFFMGRMKYGSNRGSDCGQVGKGLIKLVSQVLTVHVDEERKIAPTDPELFETPFVFMNGHNDFVLAEEDIASLRVYFEHGGFMLASGCCTNPAFPKAWKREFNRIFPNVKIKELPYSHPIYRSFHKIERIKCQHEDRDIHLEGLIYKGSLVAAMCSDGLCCGFAMDNACDPNNGITPEDAKKLGVNVAVYALTH